MYHNKLTLPQIIRIFLGIIITFASASALSLPEDSEQPIQITANSAIKDQKLGLTIYEGDVDIQQGTLNIKADKVTIYSTEDAVTRIIAEGKPARFKQKPEVNKGDVFAKAETIEYKVGQKKVTLTTNASLDQDGSVFNSNNIVYDIEAARAEGKGNVSVTIQPQKNQP